MKKSLLYGGILALVLCFLFCGTGFNVVHYCCAQCAQEGIVRVAAESCEAVHHHIGHSHTAQCHHEDGCWFKRLALSPTFCSHFVALPSIVASRWGEIERAESLLPLPCVLTLPAFCKAPPLRLQGHRLGDFLCVYLL